MLGEQDAVRAGADDLAGRCLDAAGLSRAGNICEEPAGVLRPVNDLRRSPCPILREHTGAPAATFLCAIGVA